MFKKMIGKTWKIKFLDEIQQKYLKIKEAQLNQDKNTLRELMADHVFSYFKAELKSTPTIELKRDPKQKYQPKQVPEEEIHEIKLIEMHKKVIMHSSRVGLQITKEADGKVYFGQITVLFDCTLEDKVKNRKGKELRTSQTRTKEFYIFEAKLAAEGEWKVCGIIK